MKPVNTQTTGCDFLDSKGVDSLTWQEGAEFCLNECPYPECKLDEKIITPRTVQATEWTIQCLHCHTLETVTSHGGQFENASRFVKMGDEIYHLCLCGKCKVISRRKV